MGSTQSTWGVTLKILWTQLFNMYKLVIASVLAVASSLPIEDTAEVAAAKEAFNAVFTDAEAGGLAAKQAAQIADSFLADDEAVAASLTPRPEVFPPSKLPPQFMRSLPQLPSQPQ